MSLFDKFSEAFINGPEVTPLRFFGSAVVVALVIMFIMFIVGLLLTILL